VQTQIVVYVTIDIFVSRLAIDAGTVRAKADRRRVDNRGIERLCCEKASAEAMAYAKAAINHAGVDLFTVSFPKLSLVHYGIVLRTNYLNLVSSRKND
jgi:hypothetical protein